VEGKVLSYISPRALAENFPRGQRKKDRKSAKNTEKIALFSLFRGEGGNGKKTEK